MFEQTKRDTAIFSYKCNSTLKSHHVKNEFELTADLGAPLSQMAQQPTFSSFKEVFI